MFELLILAANVPSDVIEPVINTGYTSKDLLLDIAKVFSGGLFGSILTWYIGYRRNKIQTLKCFYTDDEVISKLPGTLEDGSQTLNYHYKEFQLKNTTNRDISLISVIFEFDANSKIVKKNTLCKHGVNATKFTKSKKLNEAIVNIKNFNRNDCVTVKFDITDINTDHFNIVEAEVTGIQIICQDNRKPKQRSTVQFVPKDKIQIS